MFMFVCMYIVTVAVKPVVSIFIDLKKAKKTSFFILNVN